jgi:pimeloyl-ACP methyl ester carboxylesterase
MRLVRRSLVAVLLACCVAYLVYQLRDPERRDLDDAARREAPGRFVRLTDGVTHYETAGPATGAVVVLPAAFSVPAYIWDTVYQRLPDSGFRVLRYDYYGRGWSDRADVSYDQDLFVRQLDELLDSLRIDEPVDLAGLSFGATIATSFADRYPARVRSLIYIDPVFNARRPLPPEERSPLAWNIHMVFRGGTDAMANGQLFDFLHPERHPDWVARYRRQQQFEGTRETWRRTRAEIAVAPHQKDQIHQVAAHPRPVLVVWGRQDPVAPFSESQALLAEIPRAAFVPVDSAGHLPHLEQPDVVVPAMVRFLRSVRRLSPPTPPASARETSARDPAS